MNKNYYIVQRGIQTGPMLLKELLQIKYVPNTLVWTQGFDDWLIVNNKEELFKKLGITYPEMQAVDNSGAIPFTTRNSTSNNYTNTANPKVFISNDINNTHGYLLASRAKRALAFLFNWIITGVVFKFISNMSSSYNTFSYFFIPLISLATYNIWSANVGQKILGLKVINATTGEEFRSPVKGFLREICKYFLLWFTIPVIWCLWDDRKQNLYDKIFDTIVVEQK